MLLNKHRAIALAEKMANEEKIIVHVITVCLPRGYDLMTDEDFQTSEKKSLYKAVPHNT